MPAPIVLLTDFGLSDGYAGVLHGVILGLNPGAQVVDLSHDVPPQDIRAAAYVLSTAYRYFPAGSIFVVVVDPGVGSARQPIAVEAEGRLFVAPDNGVLTPVLAEEGARVVRLSEPRYWLPNPSRTFHGRDIFAPVAAHLSMGVPLSALGEPLAEPVLLPASRPERRPDGGWLAHIQHIDRFGNLITDLRPTPEALGQIEGAEVHGRPVSLLVETYADIPPDTPALLIGSGGYLEIAVRDGDAHLELGAEVGDDVMVYVTDVTA